MFKVRGELKEEDTDDLQNQEALLVLSIDQNGKIKYYNKECEKIIGYYKNEVLDKEFDFLIPDQYYDQWKKMFDSVKQDKQINDFKLPWLTKEGQEAFASWNIAPVGGGNGPVESIGLVGKLIDVKDQPLKNTTSKGKPRPLVKKHDDVMYKFGNKRIFLRPDPNNNIKKMDEFDDIKKKPSLKMGKISKTIGVKTDKKISSRHKTKGTDYKKVMKKYNTKNLEKNYEEFNRSVRSIKTLKQKNKELEKENKKLDKKLTRSKKKPVKKKKTTRKEKDVIIEIKNLYNKYSSFLFDILGADEKRKEFDKIISEFDERKKMLNDFEDELNTEKIKFNKSRDAFIRWREKLEILEDEIEKRRIEVTDQEDRFERKLVESLKQNLRDKSINELESLISSKGVDQGDIHHEVLDKIPQSALIVQRGILKQINMPFSEMIGFNSDEIVDKSFFDFIAPEGLYGIEKYYINRLKGGESSSYSTIFLTNDNKMISAEVNIKPMLYNGEKADMIVITDLDDMPSSDSDVQEFRSNSISKMEAASERDSVPVESKPVAETTQSVVEPSPEEPAASLGGRKSQTEINDIINKMKPEDKGDGASEVEQPPKEESKPEEPTAPLGGKMSQDAISAMFDKENTKKEKKGEDTK